VRGLGGEVLRSYDETRRDDRRWLEDFVYQNGRLLAATRRNETGGEDRFAFALDHLGSTRRVYDWSGNLVQSNTYYPFGQEAAAPGAADFAHKFTGHERDQNDSGLGMLDYMHARYHSPVVGRFLAVDPAGASPMLPQSWNRYSYVLNRPTVFRDPKGLMVEDVAVFFLDLCEIRGFCTDQVITVYASNLRFSKVMMKFFGFPTYGREGNGALGNSPDAYFFDFAENVQEAREMGIGDIAEFYDKAKTGGKWDIKRLCPSSVTSERVPCQNFGNYHFGAVAAAAGVPLELVTTSAGFYQVSGGGSRIEWIFIPPFPLTQPPYGDDPTDNFFITMGWNGYQKAVGQQ
jgi:RHS repeat-associated protein